MFTAVPDTTREDGAETQPILKLVDFGLAAKVSTRRAVRGQSRRAVKIVWCEACRGRSN